LSIGVPSLSAIRVIPCSGDLSTRIVAMPGVRHRPPAIRQARNRKGGRSMNAFEKINIAILLATVSYIIAVNDRLARVEDIEPAARWAITVLTSVGLFRLLFVFVFWVIKRSDTLLAVFHRERFLKGLWTYRYEVDGQVHVGLWRVTQDLGSISVTGYGIDPSGRIDSHFRSISQMFEHQGVDEIMFARTDSATGDDHFAKSTLYIDAKSRPNWFSGPTFMRVQSVLYGFEEAGFRNADLILRRVGDDRGEAQIVEELCGHAIDRIPAIVG
jgi:hypothetical protein